MMPHSLERGLFRAGRVLILLFIVAISLGPLAWTILSSLKTDNEIFTSAFSMPKNPLFGNYIVIFQTTPMIKFFGNSVLIATIATILSMFVYGMSGYVLARTEFRGRNTIFAMLSVSLLIPAAAIILPIYLTWFKLGLYNTRMGLIIIYMALSMPVTLMVLRGYFRTVPHELEDAAAIDGSSFVSTYFRIIVPVTKPAFATTAVFSYILAWNDFLYAFMLTKSNRVRTLPIALKYFTSAYGSDYNLLFAAISVIIIPTVIVYFLMQKTIARSLVAGAVKG